MAAAGLIGAVAAAPRAGDAGAQTVERLGWLAGCWEGTLSSGASYEETWLAPRAGTLLGVARMTREGRTLSYEFMRINDVEGTLVYTVQPSGQALARFSATETSDSAVTFENPEHDFPQRIRYLLTPPDGLTATIDGERNGQQRALEFPLRRVGCPGATGSLQVGVPRSDCAAGLHSGRDPAWSGAGACSCPARRRGRAAGRSSGEPARDTANKSHRCAGSSHHARCGYNRQIPRQ